MFIIPDHFARFMIELSGDEGQAWLKRLPEILAACEQRWHLKLEAPVKNLSFNYVASGVLADGREVILKTGLTDEFPVQPLVLRHFAGYGSVQMLEYDAENNVMLLERLRPGTSLRELKDDEKAISTAIEVMRKLWRPLPTEHYAFPTISAWGKGFARIRKLYMDKGVVFPFETIIIDRAENLFAELSASMEDPVLLHGDLHQDNILAAEREAWLAVDPKGVIGEPAYETGAILRNFWPDILSVPDPRRLMARRIDQFSAELDIDRQRIYDWGYAQAVLSLLWGFEDVGRFEKEGRYFVELLASIE